MRGSLPVILSGSLFLLVAGCASTDWEARYLQKEQQARALQQQYDVMNQSLAEREAASEILESEFSETRAQIDTLAAELERVRSQGTAPAALSTDDAARLNGEVNRLRSKYGDQVKLTPEGNIEITLPASISFASGSYALTEKGQSTLDSVAQDLKGQFAGHMVRVIGHTDNDPIRKSPFKDNWELGAERALEVIRYLSTKHGIDGSRLVGASRGETAPVAANQTQDGKDRNRRVEIVVVIPRRDVLPSVGKN